MSFKIVVERFDNIKVYDSARDAAKALGVSAMTISNELKGKKTVLNKSGYTVKKYENFYNIQATREHNIDTSGNKSTKSKCVHKLDMFTNEILDTYENITKAAESLNVPGIGLISLCCKGERKSAYGYKWEYKNIN